MSKQPANIVQILRERGLVVQVSAEAELDEHLTSACRTVRTRAFMRADRSARAHR